MNIEEVKGILAEHGAIIEDAHLVLTSGKHSSGYINVRRLAGKVDALNSIGFEIADLIEQRLINLNPNNKPDAPIKARIEGDIVIVGPETIGRSLAHATTCASDITDLTYAWCEPADNTSMRWNPKIQFAEMVKGKLCFIVDDVLTTAKTLRETADLICATGGTVMGAVVVVRRNPAITAEAIGIPWLESLIDIDLPIYEPDNCPLCQQKVPMWLHPGHGHEWIKDHTEYPVK